MPLRVRLYRYFFYAWLFHDADLGTLWERSAALRHNREAARWLPLYLFRWLVAGTVLITLEQISESISGDSPMSALLAVMVIFVVMFHLITGILWAVLQVGRQSR
jgi:formate hydrogenlyase subunit 4